MRATSTIFPYLRHLEAFPPQAGARWVSFAQTLALPELKASNLASAQDKNHLHQVHHHLEVHSSLKVNLCFHDPSSEYLRRLVLALHNHYGHGLPSSHSSTCGWFWDVRPQPETLGYRARSETMGNFPWHTDNSYETAPARFFALHVLQHDRCGGGTLSLLKVDRLLDSLSQTAKLDLSKPNFRIAVPPEFRKDGEKACTPTASGGVTPLTARAEAALQELMRLVAQHKETHALHLTSEMLPEGSIVLMDNGRWLHSRNEVRDPERHLRRVRWDATPFSDMPSVNVLDRVEASGI
ncbi:hypothetical protein HK57_00247 [Aspergillus ustus]|uniref:TauD/TfdA-like domain-containing protein n=1 Tax=Aspergillus ustus TaxID=40382 RepID=A0A0C1C498_ASPUT|nr:hypothetical protein HK57_00247 [Aspergillus ustus]